MAILFYVYLLFLYFTEPGDSGLDFYAVAVVRKSNPNIKFETLKGTKACHTGKKNCCLINIKLNQRIYKSYINIFYVTKML